MATAPEEALRALFQAHFGFAAESCAALPADASARRYWRLGGGGRTAVGAVNADLKENRAFIGFARAFRGAGLPVPEVYAEDAAAGAYLEEDLGDRTLFEALVARRGPELPAEALDLYGQAVDLLPRFQIQAAGALDYGLCHPRAAFDRQSMLWDLNYFKYYFLRLAKVPFDEQALEQDFRRFADFLLEADRSHFLYRDFQSRNIMVRGGRPWFIDFQGGRRGALQYDVASLLLDAKADLPFELRDRLLERYLKAARTLAPVDEARFRRHYPGYALIRVMQALGAYGLRGFYERKDRFLQSIPYAIRNLEHLLGQGPLPVAVPELTAVWKRLVAASALRRFGSASLELTVRVRSFSYRDGLPSDDRGHGGGFVFDCRSLPNPGRERRFADLTGTDPAVADFLGRDPAVRAFLDSVFALVDRSVDNYRTRNFTDLLVSFGCTGGRHRSVYCAERLAQRLKQERKVAVDLKHLAEESA